MAKTQRRKSRSVLERTKRKHKAVMPNHAKAIEQATLWDILDQGAVSRLAAALASDTPRRDHPEDALRYAAKEILREAAKSPQRRGRTFCRIRKGLDWNWTPGDPSTKGWKTGRTPRRKTFAVDRVA